jgi:hypothetical protein
VKIALLVPIAIWGTSVVVWRWVVRRLGLGRIPDAELSDRERLVHRNLRRLLAFNYLLWYPVSLPAVVAMLFSGDRDLAAPHLLPARLVPAGSRGARPLERSGSSCTN